jgi:hypothetical protein
MNITRIVTIALVLTTLVVSGVFAYPVSAKAVTPIASLMVTGISNSPTSGDCFNVSYHAASDCDRLAPAPRIFIEAARLSPQACYSVAYHATSDCDRLAPAPRVVLQLPRLSLQSCYSNAYHASSDCDQLAFAQKNSIPANDMTSQTCFSKATHAASDCDRLMTSGQGSPQSVNPALQGYFAVSDGDRLAASIQSVSLVPQARFYITYYAACDGDRFLLEGMVTLTPSTSQ